VKVTFCIYDKPDSVGGPITWVQRLIPMLRERGIEPRCLFLLHWGDTGPALESLRAQGIDCTAVLAPDRTEDRIRWILERLRENPPDVFVPNLVVAGYFAGRWVREAGIPTIGVLHSDDPYYEAILSEFVDTESQYGVSSIVCVSNELERQALKIAPRETRVSRISYGVPFPTERAVAPDKLLRIAYVGRLAQKQKRIEEVTRAMCRAVAEVPGTEGVIYGDGPERGRVLEILEDDARELPIHLAGSVPAHRIQSELLKAHVIVLLSDFEGLPIALMEAMACGCVPVCSRMKSGIPELITDGVSGILVDDRGDSFVGAIKRLRADETLWEKLSDNARTVAARFSNEECANQWADLIRTLAPSQRPRPIQIPARIRLPRFNPFLESTEQRSTDPGLARIVYQRSRILAGRLRRKVFGF
jgi:glycosyltransferase involved in cell wall biosynthesis